MGSYVPVTHSVLIYAMRFTFVGANRGLQWVCCFLPFCVRALASSSLVAEALGEGTKWADLAWATTIL